MTRHSHEIFDSKGRRGLVQRARQALGWVDGLEGVKESVRASGATDGPESGPEGGRTGGNWSGFTTGETSGSATVDYGGNPTGNADVAQRRNSTVVLPEPGNVVQPGEEYGEPDGVELHVVDGRLIACRPGEPPPLSLRQHTEAFLEWLRDHPQVPGNEVPVAIMEHVLYWDFLRETGLPMKTWRPVSDTLAKLPGVKKYQADWRAPTGEGPTPMVFKISKRRHAKVVDLGAAKRERA